MTKPETLLDMLHRIDTADPRLEPTREEWARAADSIRDLVDELNRVKMVVGETDFDLIEALLARLDAPKEPGE